MKFYFYGKNGCHREMTDEEVHQHLTTGQIEDSINAKKADPLEEVSYMTVGGFIVVDF